MTVDYSGYLVCGDTCLNVNVSSGSVALPHALVALYMNDSLYASCYTDDDGLAEVNLDQPIQEFGMMELNVTARNKIPVFETVEVLTDVREYKSSDNLSIYPNPVSSSVMLRFTIYEEGFTTLELFDITGENVKSVKNEIKTPGNYEMEVDFSNLPKGVYFITLKSNKEIQSTKLIKL